MNSGPLTVAIALPDLQPGSSIMPQLNATKSRGDVMITQVIGNDVTITVASGEL